MFSSPEGDKVIVGKFLSNGLPDITFGTGGYSAPVPLAFSDAALQEDGKLLLAGSTIFGYHPDIHDDLMLVRLDTDGTLDESFNNSGVITTTYTNFSYEFTTSIVIRNEMIVVGGYSVSLVGRFATYHYDAFDLAGNTIARVHLGNIITDLENYSPADYQYSFAVQGEKVLVTSITYDPGSGTYTSALYRFNQNGSPDLSFGTGGFVLLDDGFFSGPMNVQSQGDKTIVTSYTQDPLTNHYGFAVVRFTNTGLPDLTFNGTGRQFTDFGTTSPVVPTAVLVEGDRIYIGGNMVDPVSQKTAFALARYTSEGLPDNSFDSDGKQVTALPGYHLSLEKMEVVGNRLAVSGIATANPAQPGEFLAVVAMYILEDEKPVTINCPRDTMVATATGLCTAIVKGIDPIISEVAGSQSFTYALQGDITATGRGTASGLCFPAGTTSVVYTLDNDSAKKCSFKVSVTDKEAPSISNIAASRYNLWPPNHKMVDIWLSYDVNDNCGIASNILSVSSNAGQGRGKDNAGGDWKIIDNRHVQLRAEKWKGTGTRFYTIQVKVEDAAGNSTVKSLVIPVAKGLSSQFTKLAFGLAEGPGRGLKVRVLNNPSTNQFTILTQSTSPGPVSMRVMNAAGVLVEIKSALPAKGQVQVGSNYNAGLYLAEFIQGAERVVVKLVKQ